MRCWNSSQGGEDSIIVHITDMCPCVQYEDTARPTRVTGVNTPCCGDVYHVRRPAGRFEERPQAEDENHTISSEGLNRVKG